MTPEEIRAQLILAGISQSDIARRYGVTSSAITRVIYGNMRSQRLREAIAAAIGKKAAEVWPDAAA